MTVVLALVGVVAFAISRGLIDGDDSGECAEPAELTVGVPSELRPAVDSAAREVGDSICARFDIRVVQEQKLVTGAADPAALPDLWVPRSTTMLAPASRSGVTADVVAESIATSPIVVVSGRVQQPDSWLGLLTADQVLMPDPLRTGVGAAALTAVQAERAETGVSDAQVGRAILPLAQRHGDRDKPLTDVASILDKVVAGAGEV